MWLEGLLKEASFAFVLISHDRVFLENVATRVVELHPQYAEGYLSVMGNYSAFLVQREEYLAAQANRQDALQTQVKREIEWLQRGAQARSTKAQGRIQQAGQMIDELAELKYRSSQNRSAGIDFSASGRQTRELIVGKDLSKTLGDKTLFQHLSLTLAPGSRLGLLGPNGSGKTTLIKLLTGQLEPDAGKIKRADSLRVVLFDQSRAQLDKTLSLRDALSPNSDNVIYRGNPMHVSGWAKRFLFKTEQLNTPIRYLSGGEQARILIAQLMLHPADVLILDEPTNDLDIPTLEVLEDSLLSFPGALVLVTHDRYLLENVSTDLLALDGRGGAAHFASLDQWQAAQRPAPTAAPASAPRAKSPAPAAAARLTTAERRELSQIEAKIEAADEALAELQRQMEDPVIASHAIKLQEVWNALPLAAEAVTALYTRWDELEAKRG
jgi:ATP-binding cassette subfamily F protein uup